MKDPLAAPASGMQALNRTLQSAIAKSSGWHDRTRQKFDSQQLTSILQEAKHFESGLGALRNELRQLMISATELDLN